MLPVDWGLILVAATWVLLGWLNAKARKQRAIKQEQDQ